MAAKTPAEHMAEADRLSLIVTESYDSQVQSGVPFTEADLEFYDIGIKLANLHLRLADFKLDPRKNEAKQATRKR